MTGAEGPRRTVGFNAGEWLVDRHVRDGRAEAVCFRTGGQDTVSYGELLDLVSRYGRVFADAGIGPGCRVLVALPDTVTAAVTILALVRAGAVAVPVSPRLRPDDHRRIAADCAPHGAVLTARLARLAAHLPESGPAWVADPGTGAGVDTGPPLRDLPAELAAVREGAAPAVTGPDDLALIQYTSGSTGAPTGVMHRHAALRGAPAGLVERLGLGPDDVLLSASKLAFGYGLGNSVLVPLSVGASSVLVPEPTEPAVVARELARHRPTVFFAVPTLYAALLSARDAATRFPLGLVRAYVSSGEHLNAALGRRLTEAFGPGLLDVFGSTETLYSFVSNQPGRWVPDRLGDPFGGWRLRVGAPDGGQGSGSGAGSGDLWVSGPGVAAGYWRRPEQTAARFRDGWVHTGDHVSRTADGGLSHLGRTDDVIKVGGFKVAPREIEEVLLGHPRVAHCAAVGVADGDGITRVVAFVAAPGADAGRLGAELRALVRDRLAPERRPARIEFVDELPSTSTGKTSRYLLRRAAAGTLR